MIAFKWQIIAEIKDLTLNEIKNSFKESFLKFFVNKVSTNRSSDSDLHQLQILFL